MTHEPGTSSSDVATIYLVDIRRTFRNQRTLAEAALEQTSDLDLFRRLDADANSIAVLMAHLGGNLRSRFADFLTTDGEKPDRNRDTEFSGPEQLSRETLEALWASGWSTVLATLDGLTPADLRRTVTIRGEAFWVPEALNRAAAHVSYHVGQMVLLAKHFAGPAWRTLSIPKGRSSEFSSGVFKRGIIPTRP